MSANISNEVENSPPETKTTPAQVDRRPSQRRRKIYAVSTTWERQLAEGRSQPDVHTYFCCCAQRIGNMFSLLSYQDGSPMVIAGPCWPFCALVTVPLILGVSGTVCYFLIVDNSYSSLPQWLLYLYIPAVLFVLLSLFCVSCRDPGLMERVTDEEAGEGGWFWNEQVGSFRPPGALYCRECGVLIQDYDHLCPWTGTSIGKKNMWAFKTFVISVNMLCYLSIGILVWALLDGLAS
ncbi:hypothetical protein FisN_1Lh615 [Fistulifera solaris]|uniref:Palmitoyltransferase n=1 Tax=Fistulifera solaris TaxID=1519565 RepID=A0A1Z5K1C7_FISSO|nr:hypothetical protein FisN_1Lh615 [Fistulifera solaris]|eukprot:GAX19916.1 hypothetical protein FisN_1Lh615 [Fistulifera solaris]